MKIVTYPSSLPPPVPPVLAVAFPQSTPTGFQNTPPALPAQLPPPPPLAIPPVLFSNPQTTVQSHYQPTMQSRPQPAVQSHSQQTLRSHPQPNIQPYSQPTMQQLHQSTMQSNIQPTMQSHTSQPPQFHPLPGMTPFQPRYGQESYPRPPLPFMTPPSFIPQQPLPPFARPHPQPIMMPPIHYGSHAHIPPQVCRFPPQPPLPQGQMPFQTPVENRSPQVTRQQLPQQHPPFVEAPHHSPSLASTEGWGPEEPYYGRRW
ncbi:hypothetical protein TWF694_008805 [Orbilia ellipsospora]|uniref:Uncharacterized protein n=1 Tax=Orbilia ellipsospora TaxID=2528407 RepID=A0AAV9XDD8_9PEZI